MPHNNRRIFTKTRTKRLNTKKFYIGTDAAAQNAIELISNETILALDTEFTREKTYYPELSLMQIASKKFGVCIDCLSGLNIEPIVDMLLQPGRYWILHSARQDLEVIYGLKKQLPEKIFDTQIAAGLGGFAPQVSLQGLLNDLLNVQLEKKYSRTDWSRRPLSAGALDYAFDDVFHLIRLWETLRKKLEKLGRYGWVTEDCQALLENPPIPDTTQIWDRMKGLGKLNLDAQCAAYHLICWREKTAQKLNRPRRWILSDEILLKTAHRLPSKLEELKSIAGLPMSLIERSGLRILKAIALHNSKELLTTVKARSARNHPGKEAFKHLQSKISMRASELGINVELLATRREITEILRGEYSKRTRQGWRAKELEKLT